MRSLATALLAALLLAGCGEEDEEPEEPPLFSVCEAIDAPEPPDGEIRLSGEVIPLSQLGTGAHPGSSVGFVLTEDGCSTLVAGPSRETVALEQREPVVVHGLVDELEEVEAERMARILGEQAAAADVPGGLSLTVGTRFIDAFTLIEENPAN